MATPVISGNDIFSHVFLGAVDLKKSVVFYDAALGALGIKNLGHSVTIGFCTVATNLLS